MMEFNSASKFLQFSNDDLDLGKFRSISKTPRLIPFAFNVKNLNKGIMFPIFLISSNTV